MKCPAASRSANRRLWLNRLRARVKRATFKADMRVLTRTNGDEVLIPDRELNGLFTELRDLLQRQTEQARTEERQRCAGIVRNFDFTAGHQYTQEDVDEQKEQCAKEIESDGD